MRIVFFVHRYWPVVGGVEKYIHELAKAVVAAGHDVQVVTGADPADLPDRDEHEGISILRFPALRSPQRMRWWMWRHADLFRQADVIHVSNTHMLETFWRISGSGIDPRKVFLTRHGMSYVRPVPESEKRRAVRSLKFAAGVVHDGEFIEKWLGSKPDLCPDQGLSPPADQLEAVPPPPPESAVFIGRLERDSGISVYIRAVRLLTHEHGRRFTLHVYGDGAIAPQLRERVDRERLTVKFHGRVADAQRHITDSCFAFIDGRMAIQEAMARRRLVFSAFTDLLKRDYVAGEPFSPHLVPVADGSELASRVLHYIDNPQLLQEQVEGAFEYSRKLTWKRTAEAYLGFWKERLACSGSQQSRADWLGLRRELAQETRLPKERWAVHYAAPASTVPLVFRSWDPSAKPENLEIPC